MRSVRAAIAICLGAGLLAGPSAAAQTTGSNPYWESRSNIPVETLMGEWAASDNGRTVELSISGYNLPGQQTSFEAGWKSPWVASQQNLEDGGNSDLLFSPITSADLIEMTRMRAKGKPWSRWFKNELPYEEGLGMGGVGVWAGSAGMFHPRTKVQYEWRLVGEIDGAATIEANIEISVK